MIKVNTYLDIPGWGKWDTVYKEIFSSLPSDADIFEIGVGYGRGTWAMLDAMGDNMSLYVLDVFSSHDLYKHILRNGSFPHTLPPKYYKRLRKRLPNSKQKEVFINNVSQHTRFSQIKDLYEMRSTAYIAQNKRSKFDLVFLDGDHSCEVVTQELEYFKDCTLVTGHDYDDSCPGVVEAVDAFLKKYTDRKMTVFKKESVFVIEKKS